MTKTKAVKQPLKWHGGKFYLSKWLHEVAPPHKHRVYLYAGGLGEAWNWPHEGVSEVANDLNGYLVNFYRVLKDPKKFRELARSLSATPFSRIEWEDADATMQRLMAKTRPEAFDPKRPDPKLAVLFFVWNRQSMAGRMDAFSPLSKSRTRGGRNGEVNAWWASVDGLGEVCGRLDNFVVEHLDALKLAKKEDSKDTLFYCLMPGSLVRTEDERFVRVEEVKKGDRLAPGRTVLDTVCRVKKGLCATLKVHGLPDLIKVTSDHKIPAIRGKTGRQEKRSPETLWSAQELIPAGDLRPGDYLLIPSGGHVQVVDWGWSDLSKRNGRRREDVVFKDCPEFHRLIGYYAAEGHVQGSHGLAQSVLLSFGTHERDTWVADAVRCCRAAFGFTPLVRPGPVSSVTQVKINSSSVAEFIRRLVPDKKKSKHLAAALMTAGYDVQKEILVGWLRGDGGVSLNGRGGIKLTGTSGSPKLARQMFTLATRIGLCPSFKTRESGGTVAHDVFFSKADTARLGWTVPDGRDHCRQRKVVAGHVLARLRSIELTEYEGPVYDLDVDGDDLFCAPFALVHNCDPTYVVSTEKGEGRSTGDVYHVETTNAHHEALVEWLAGGIKGKMMLSGYRNKLYDSKLTPKNGWRRLEKKIDNKAQKGAVKRQMTECLWVNFT